MDSLEDVGIIAIVNMILSLVFMGIFVIVTNQPNDSLAPIIVSVIAFVVLSIVEFLCWLFHIPEWVVKGLTWIRQETEPRE